MNAALNYHHLQHFHAVARAGSLTAASRELLVAKPTLSAQIKALERAIGEPLFQRVSRGLVLTHTGQMVQRFAEEIFSLGSELKESLRGSPTARSPRLNIGVADTMPKTIVYRILAPCLRMDPPMCVICREGAVDQLLAALSIHELDVVLADGPMNPAEASVRAYNHLLGECGVSVLGVPGLARRYRRGFPRSLSDAPFLLPVEGVLRRSLDAWLEAEGISVRPTGEFQDSALLKVFGQEGVGLFLVPTVVEREVCRNQSVSVVGRIKSLREHFYAISVERRIRHPAILAIRNAAQSDLF